MAYINVAEWTPDQVTDWLKGKFKINFINFKKIYSQFGCFINTFVVLLDATI